MKMNDRITTAAYALLLIAFILSIAIVHGAAWFAVVPGVALAAGWLIGLIGVLRRDHPRRTR